jgi:hypothetical protein
MIFYAVIGISLFHIQTCTLLTALCIVTFYLSFVPQQLDWSLEWLTVRVCGSHRERESHTHTHTHRHTHHTHTTHTHIQTYTHIQTHIQMHSVGLLWKSDQHVAQNATYTTHNKRRTSTPLSGILTRDPRNLDPADPRLRPHGHSIGMCHFYWS